MFERNGKPSFGMKPTIRDDYQEAMGETVHQASKTEVTIPRLCKTGIVSNETRTWPLGYNRCNLEKKWKTCLLRVVVFKCTTNADERPARLRVRKDEASPGFRLPMWSVNHSDEFGESMYREAVVRCNRAIVPRPSPR